MNSDKTKKSVRGMRTIAGVEARAITQLIMATVIYAEDNEYETVYLPVVEYENLYTRNIGETSDIVQKELYTFKDKGDRNLALRPEFTAGIARHYVETWTREKANKVSKYFTFGPVFRYDRPQANRYRQFLQCNFEIIGDCKKGKYLKEVEILETAFKILQNTGTAKVSKFSINFLGSEECRRGYKEYLIKEFSYKKNELSENAQAKIMSNPLRILDSKDERDIEVVEELKEISEFYTVDDKKYMKKVMTRIKKSNLPYEVCPKMVRGLDYYDGMVFEYNVAGLTVLGGGSYSKLISAVSNGKIDKPAIGFAIGVDRLISSTKLIK